MKPAPTPEPARHVCLRCGYTYDDRRGDSAGAIPAGVPFSRLPVEWRCPGCGAARDQLREERPA